MLFQARDLVSYLYSFGDIVAPFVRPVPRIPDLADYFEGIVL